MADRASDVSDPTRPVALGTWSLPESAIVSGRVGAPSGFSFLDGVHDPDLLGDVAYFSWYSQGVVAADFSNPKRLRLLARFAPTPAPEADGRFCPGRRCSAVWGVYPTSSYVLASDLVGGLWVLRLQR